MVSILPIEPSLLAIALLIVFIAATAQGYVGLGFGQISAAGLIWIEPQLVPATVILMAFVVGAIGAFRDRRNPTVSNLCFDNRFSVQLQTEGTANRRYVLIESLRYFVTTKDRLAAQAWHSDTLNEFATGKRIFLVVQVKLVQR